MDALMVVHQLQRLAAEPRPSATVRGKIPRMSVGLSYFLEHQDVRVAHQAAGALRLLVRQHAKLLVPAPEVRELEAALRKHALPSNKSSSDPVVQEACEDCLKFLREAAAQRSAEENVASSGRDDASPWPSTLQSLPCSSKLSEEASSPASACAVSGSFTRGREGVEEEEDDERKETLDLYSVVLGLRGLLDDPANRSLLSRHGGVGASHFVEGEDRRGVDNECRVSLELLQRDLQLRLVRVWGVSSATVTLNEEALLAEAALADGSTSSSARQEGDGVAVVLMRLSKKPEKLQRQLRDLRAAVGPLTLLLKSHVVQRASTKLVGKEKTRESPSERATDGRAPDFSVSSVSFSVSSGQCQGQSAAASTALPTQESGYLDEEIDNPASRQAETQGTDGSGEPPKSYSSSSGAGGGFSFFSSNSALFAQSRFIGGMLRPTDTDSDMSARLKAEKERKARLRAQQEQGGLISKLVSRLGSGANLL